MKIKFEGIALSLIVVGLLAGCGGGGGSSSAPATTLSGTAAVGLPIVGGTVKVTCAAGTAITGIPNTGTTGAWSVNVSGQTLPCAVQVSDGTINGVNNTTPYHAIATASGTVNVTPLTDLIVANLAGASTPSTWFTGLSAAPAPLATITQTNVDSALSKLRTAFPALTPLVTINPITTSFTAISGNASDDMLVALKTAMTNTAVTHAALLSNAAVPAFNPPAVTGFDTALTAAYAGTASGSGGGGTGGGAITCDTAQFTAGSVRVPTTTELASYAATLTGIEGTIGPNPGDPFIANGTTATLVLNANGTANYNGAALSITSICLGTASPTLYIMTGGMSHFDLFSGFTGLHGVAPNGNIVM